MAKIEIKGVIVSSNDQEIYDWIGIDATSPKKVQAKIEEANGETLEVEINSPGGSVFDGSEIYTTLREYKNTVTVKIVGLAASAASVIAMAGDKVLISPTAQIMIHNASVRTSGDYRDMDHMSGILKNTNQTIANAYQLKNGMSQEELLKLMDAETWLTPQQAIQYGFADEILFRNSPKQQAEKNLEQLKNKMKTIESE